MLIGTGAISERRFAALYRAADGTKADASGDTQIPANNQIQSLRQSISSEEKLNSSEAKEIIRQLSEDETYKVLTEPTQQKKNSRMPPALELGLRLTLIDNDFDSANETIGIFDAICDKFQSSPKKLEEIMYFLHWKKTVGMHCRSPITYLFEAIALWNSNYLTEKISPQITPNQKRLITERLYALTDKIRNYSQI